MTTPSIPDLIAALEEHDGAMTSGEWRIDVTYGPNEELEYGWSATGPHHVAREDADEHDEPGGPVEARALTDAAAIAWFGTHRGELLEMIKAGQAARATLDLFKFDALIAGYKEIRDGLTAEVTRLRRLLDEAGNRIDSLTKAQAKHHDTCTKWLGLRCNCDATGGTK